MRPKKPEATGEADLFRARLDQIINMKHELTADMQIVARSRLTSLTETDFADRMSH
jgi:hypothetical protein